MTPLMHACREIVRHAGHPAQLRANEAVRRILAAAGVRDELCPDGTVRALVTSFVEDALREVSPRQATIVRRCGLGGERYRDVARELFMSERHAFRERDAALRVLLERLERLQPSASAIVVPHAIETADPLDAHVAQARTLEQNGQWRIAADLLEALGENVDDPLRRSGIEAHLVRIYADAERFVDAQTHVDSARRLTDGSGASWHEAEIDAAAALLAEATGDGDAAIELARRAAAQLHAALDRDANPRIRNALIETYGLRASIALDRGDIETMQRYAAAALATVEAGVDVDPRLAIAARSLAAMSAVFGSGDLEQAEREMLACYKEASDAGLTREAIAVATHLAGVYRFTKRPERSIAFLEPLMPTARLVSTREFAAALTSELAAAHLETGAPEAARAYLDDIRAFSLGHHLMQPTSDFLAARVLLATADYAGALRSARAAETVFARMGKVRQAGTSVRLQAEALAAMGETREAIKTVKRSIEMLAGRVHPERLAAAYRLLGKLSGDAKHTSTARRLVRST
jgi:tetratricopeptide (TPR) repeat protein